MQAVNYLIAEKYIAALKDLAMSPNQKILMLPTEVQGLAASLAGIAEIAKSVTQDNPPRRGSVPNAG